MLKTAIDLARSNPVVGLPRMGAVITKRKRVIGMGRNSFKTDPLQYRYSRHPLSTCKHAEIAAIKHALKTGSPSRLEGAEIFVARLLSDGSLALAKPCEGCQKALKAYGISRATWTV